MFGEAIRLAASGKDVAGALDQLLAAESSFVKWVSLRGGLAFVSLALEDPGLSLEHLAKFAERPAPEGAEGLLQIYPKLEDASFSDVLRDPDVVRNRKWHIDFIAWCAAAFAGGNLHRDRPAVRYTSRPSANRSWLVCRARLLEVGALLGRCGLDASLSRSRWSTMGINPFTFLAGGLG